MDEAQHDTDVRLPALLFALLALPFDPGWIDFEAARRGILLIVAGVLALTTFRRRPSPLPSGTRWLAALVAWSLLRSLDVTNGFEGLLRAAYWIGLAVMFHWGAGQAPTTIARALLPSGIAVATFGSAQALGLEWPVGYGRPDEPVATLGNRNVASEFATFVFALALALWTRAPRGAGRAVVAAVLGVYVGLNGTRAGLLGAVVAVAIVAMARKRSRTDLTALAAVLLAIGVGFWLRPATRAEPGPIGGTERASAPSTIDVRVEIWRNAVRMVADAPWLGHGTGQFRYEYPRFRSEDEIELTTFGRRFPTFAESVHNDPLETAVELGAIGIALLFAFLTTAVRAAWRAGARALLAPLAVFGLAALVRAPLGNAPVAAAAFALLGALATPAAVGVAGRRATITAGLVVGIPLLWFGVATTGAAICAARWVRGGDAAWLDHAVDLHASESRYRSLRVQSRCGGSDEAGLLRRRGGAQFDACRDDLTLLAQLDPNNTNALLLTAQLALGANETDAARAALGRVLTLDKREPRAQLLAALLVAQQGRPTDAVAMLYARPHPVLRARLAAVLDAFGDLPDLTATARATFAHEAAFIAAIDSLEADAESSTAEDAVARFAEHGANDDPRASVLRARIRQARGDALGAAALAPTKLVLGSALRGLLRRELDALDALPNWRAARGE